MREGKEATVAGDYNELLCPVLGCGEPLILEWSTFAYLCAAGGFDGRGEEEGEYAPESGHQKFWKVSCTENEHVILTAHDDPPNGWEMYEREEIHRSDEEGWEFSIDRVREHVAAMWGDRA